MAVGSRVVQDRRSISRVLARMDCQFFHDGTTHNATIVDFSLNGAYLSAKILPPKNSKITVTVNTPLLKKPLTLEGNVIRGSSGVSDHGRLNRFGVQFGYSPAVLLELISKIIPA